MKTLGNILVGIILGIVLLVLALGVGGYVILGSEGMMGKIDDRVDSVELGEEQRELSVLGYVNELAEALSDFSDKTVGEIESLVGTNFISYNLSETLGVSAGVIKTSALSDIGAALADNLTFNGMSDKFEIALPEDIPLFNNEDFLSRPVNEALASLDDYTLDSFISIVYDEDATSEKPASSGLLQSLGKTKLSEISNEIDSIIDDTYIVDVIDIDENSSEVMKYLASGAEGGNPFKISELDGAVADMKISDAVKITDESSLVMKYLRDYEVKDAEGNVIDTGASLSNIDTAIKEMNIENAVEITDSSSKVLRYLRGTPLTGINDKIALMEIADAVEITSDSHAVLRAISDLTLDELGNKAVLQERIDKLTLGEVITVSDDSEPILLALKDTELGNLNTKIASLQLQEVFKDYNKGILSLVAPDTEINDVASAITASVQSTTLYALRAVGLFDYKVSGDFGVISDDEISTEAVERRLTVHNSNIPDVVGAIGAGVLSGLGFTRVGVDAAALSGAGADIKNVDGTDYYVLTPAVVNVLLPAENDYGNVLVVADGVNIIVEGAFDKLFSLDMRTNDVGSDGKLLVGGELSAVGFTEKRGGYAYFSAADISYFDGGVYTALQGNVSSPDYIVTATAMVDEASGGVTTTITRKLTLVQLIETLA